MDQIKGKHNTSCNSLHHKQHICYIVAQGFHLEDEGFFKALTEEPKFKCRNCGHVAKSQDNLCEPTKL